MLSLPLVAQRGTPSRIAAGNSRRSRRPAVAADPAERPLPRRPRRRAGPRLRQRRRPARPRAGAVDPATSSCSTAPSGCALYAGRIDAAAQLAPQVLTAKPGDGIRQPRAGRPADQARRLPRGRAADRPHRRRKTSSVRCATSCGLAPRRREGFRRRARAALARLKTEIGRRPGAGHGDRRRRSTRWRATRRRRRPSIAAPSSSIRRPCASSLDGGRRTAPARQGRRRARAPQDLRRQVQRLRGDGRGDGGQCADAQAAVARLGDRATSCSTSAAR